MARGVKITDGTVTILDGDELVNVSFERCLILIDSKTYGKVADGDIQKLVADANINGCDFYHCTFNTLEGYAAHHANAELMRIANASK